MFNSIKNKYSTLSKKNKQVANYILKNPDEVIKSSAIDIGLNCGTSSATVSRFVKAIGYNSFEEMKINIAKNVTTIKEEEKLDPVILDSDTTKELALKLGNVVNLDVQYFINNMDTKTYENIFNDIINANFVYLYGIGASGLAAYDLYHKLNRINIKSRYELDAHMAVEFSNYTTKNDVVIAFSYSGQTKEVVLAAKQAKKNGSKIIAVTRDKLSPLYQLADVVLPIPNNEYLLRIGAISSKFSTLLVSDMIYLGVAKKDYKNIEKGLIDTANIARQLKMKE